MRKALAKDHGSDGITINCIAPGAVDTNMFAQVGEIAMASTRPTRSVASATRDCCTI